MLNCSYFDIEKFENIVVKKFMSDKNFKNQMKNSFKIQDLFRLFQNQMIQPSNDEIDLYGCVDP